MIFSDLQESKSGSLTIQDLIDKIPNSQHLTIEDMSDLEAHHNAVILFMGAGDIQLYLKQFKSDITKEETA